MCDLTKILKSLEGKTIQNVESYETEVGCSIYSITITVNNGDKIEIYPTNYNYGGQHLNIDFS